MTDMDKTHPGSFEYAWMTATPEVRQRFMDMYDTLIELGFMNTYDSLYESLAELAMEREQELRFMLWMARQDEDTRRSFLAIVSRVSRHGAED